MKLLICAECGIALTTVEADDAVATDAGPCHRECFQGPVPPGSEPDPGDVLDLSEENRCRGEMGDPPLDPEDLDDDRPDW